MCIRDRYEPFWQFHLYVPDYSDGLQNNTKTSLSDHTASISGGIIGIKQKYADDI